jgi:potassium/hydrogen antiporter
VLGWAGLRGGVPVVLAIFPVLADVPGSLDFFNIVFFAVVLSTVLPGMTFVPLAERLGVTTDEAALPAPLMEHGTIRRLGAEVVEFPVRAGDAVVGRRVRELGLPREALLNVIVRGDQAIPPRGSTRLRAGDQVHVLLRQTEAARVPDLVDRWRSGPIGPPPRPTRVSQGRTPVFSAWRWKDDDDGDPAAPDAVRGQPVVAQLRIRRDEPGGLWVLADGRYAVTGPVAAIGGRGVLSQWARRRITRTNGDERAWLQTVIGALASDVPE